MLAFASVGVGSGISISHAHSRPCSFSKIRPQQLISSPLSAPAWGCYMDCSDRHRVRYMAHLGNPPWRLASSTAPLGVSPTPWPSVRHSTVHPDGVCSATTQAWSVIFTACFSFISPSRPLSGCYPSRFGLLSCVVLLACIHASTYAFFAF